MKREQLGRRIIPAAMTAIIAVTAAAGVGVYALTSVSGDPLQPTVTAGNSVSTNKTAASAGSFLPASKEETVYVLAGADGSVKKVIVSSWLKNPGGQQELADQGELENIQNVKGEESYRIDADNMRIWDAQGKDIYYQGTTDKALPVDVIIRYTLDGRSISAEDLAGKSGRVSIRFDYRNKERVQTVIHGEKVEMSVPFVMLTGMILDNDCFSHIEVSNGKVINDGNHSVVMGFALPGMQENLHIDAGQLEIPNYVEITADVKNFALTTTMTLAATDLFSQLDTDKLSDLDGLRESLGGLEDASQQLMDGSSALYKGLDALLSKSDELIAGIDRLTVGAKQLAGGTGELNSGITELQKGMKELEAGLGELTGNNATLNAGAKTVFESLLSMADSQLTAAGQNLPRLTIDNYETVLEGLLASLEENAVRQKAQDAALAAVTQAVNTQEAVIREQVTLAVESRMLEGILAASGNPMTAGQYAQAVEKGEIPTAMREQIQAAVAAQMQTEGVQTQIASAVENQIQTIIRQQMESAEIQDKIEAAVKEAAAGRESIQGLKQQLDSYQKFYQGLLAYTAGVSQLQDGAGQLGNGTDRLASGGRELQTGAQALLEGLAELQKGSGALTDGVSQLRDGAMQLQTGVKDFQEQGIDKLVEVFDGDIQELMDRIKTVAEISRQYTSFIGASGTNGSVKFIYRTDAIG